MMNILQNSIKGPEQYNPLGPYQNNFILNQEILSILEYGEEPKNNPTVSIVIPTFQRPKLLQDAIRSALEQDGFDDYEIIVIDNEPIADGDSETLRIVRGFRSSRLRYYRNQKNIGMTGNWNRGIELAKGKWINLLHDDDWLSPFFLSHMMKKLPPDAAMMACRVATGVEGYEPRLFDDLAVRMDGLFLFKSHFFVRGNITSAPGLLISREAAILHGGFANVYYPCADYDFYIRISQTGKSYVLNEYLAYYRIVDSETYKPGTLLKMILMTRWMKRGLMRKHWSAISTLNYLYSMCDWYRRGANLDHVAFDDSILDNMAVYISKHTAMLNGISKLAELIYVIDRGFPLRCKRD